ncbi:FK506-binding protein 4 [Anarrhichthys ocellatus]|uniref:FK506-binding protein 4 n=1 Tax=Anarrhichthys ocellatus TaxID=433405 RepID=UPI0012EE0861|nr:FK506-binding protein 4-like [Anarrhichthys ocellatus]
MRVQCVLPVTLVLSVALVGIMKMRKLQHDKYERQNNFQDIKLRVTNDVLQGYNSMAAETENLMQKTQTEQKALEEETVRLEAEAIAAKGRSDICESGQKHVTDELTSVETELKKLQDEFEKEKTNLKTESDTLNQQLAAKSAVCGFLKAELTPASQLCGIVEAPKPEEPKAEAPKPEEPKAEAPKPEEPKAEAPKPEEPKAEAPKPEEPKAEAPKP